MIEEFPTRNFIFVRSYLFKTYIKPHVFIISILQFIWQDLVKKGLYKNTEEDIRRCSVKKMFLKISSNSQAEKVKLRRQRLRAAALFKKRHMCFPVHFAKILGTPFLQSGSGELLLKMDILQNSNDPNFWKASVKKFNFNKFAGQHLATLMKMKHFHRLVLIGLVLMSNSYFEEELPVAAFKWIEAGILLNVMTKERCEIHPVKEQNNYWIIANN